MGFKQSNRRGLPVAGTGRPVEGQRHLAREGRGWSSPFKRYGVTGNEKGKEGKKGKGKEQ